MIGQLSPGVVTLAGLTINVGTEDAEVVADMIAGWHDGPAVRADIVSRPGQHGDFPVRALREGRTVTLSGWVWGLTRARTAQIVDQLNSLLADGFYDVFTFTDDDQGVRWATMRLADAPQVTWNTHRELFEWQLALHSDDPRKYGPLRSVTISAQAPPAAGGGLHYDAGSGLSYAGPGLLYDAVPGGGSTGTVNVPNPGTANLWPRLRIDGPVANPYVVNVDTGSWLRVGLSVAAGSWLDISCANRTVLADGYGDRRYAVTYGGDWLSVEPGGATLRWSDDLLDPAARLSVQTPEGAWW